MNFMDIAIKEAEKAYKKGNVPVGCVIVCDNKVISKAHNTKNTSNISINHAEILAIRKACKKLNSWYLNNCELYVTLKPCKMCESAIAESRISKVNYLLDSNYEDNINKNLNKIEYTILKNNYKYEKLLNSFFNDKRN